MIFENFKNTDFQFDNYFIKKNVGASEINGLK